MAAAYRYSNYQIRALFFLFLLINSFSPSASKPNHRRPATSLFRNCNFDAIYQFGDSLSDTGNQVLEYPVVISTRLPYGQTYFHHPTGRYSDGRLVIDFIAWAAGLPFLNPYQEKTANFSNGVNFAVSDSTAISVKDLADKDIIPPTSKSSLAVQLDWMADHLSSYCQPGSPDCKQKLKNSLFILGETGGNDINYALFSGKTIDGIRVMIPEIVETIMDATRSIIKFGARKIVIYGNIPIGCLPSYLTVFQTKNSAFDKLHCLKEYNSLSLYQNKHLKQEIDKLQEENPDVVIVYGDLYTAAEWLFARAPGFGFDGSSLQKACCGSGGEYNFGFGSVCGTPGISSCSNPNKHISWDGLRMTERAHMFLSTWMINNIIPKLECSACSNFIF